MALSSLSSSPRALEDTLNHHTACLTRSTEARAPAARPAARKNDIAAPATSIMLLLTRLPHHTHTHRHTRCTIITLSLSLHFNGHFPGGPGLAGTRMSPICILLELRVIEVVVTTRAIRRAKLQSKCHHRQTNAQFFTDQMPFQ